MADMDTYDGEPRAYEGEQLCLRDGLSDREHRVI